MGEKIKKVYFLGLSGKEKIIVMKRLGVLLKAGMPILKSLQLLKSQTRSGSAAFIFGCLCRDVENGQYLHASLEPFRKIFGDLALNLIRIGELSGSLEENLNYLVEQMQKQQALRRKVVGALIYPVFIFAATLGISGMLALYVFPKILPVFSSFKFRLPWTTRALIAISNVFLHHGPAILLSLGVLASVIFWALKKPKFKLWADRQFLRLPVFGTMFLNYHLSNFSRTLGVLLKGEAVITEGVKIASETSSSPVYRREFLALREKLSRGEKFSLHLAENKKLFPLVFSQMIAVGEAAGNLSDTLIFLADMYEAEVEEISRNLSGLIEPALMMFMGVMVGFIALSIITPIYQLTQNLHP